MFEHARTIHLSGIAVLALGLAATLAPARAQAPEPGFRGSGRSAVGGNIAGGGVATIHGGSDDMVILYSGAGAGVGADLALPGRAARLTGGTGDGPEVEYLQPETARRGREAWVVGGGDEMQVVYTSPHAAPTR